MPGEIPEESLPVLEDYKNSGNFADCRDSEDSRIF